MLREKMAEVRQEFVLIAHGSRGSLDALLPLALFIVFLNPLGAVGAAGVAFSSGIVISVRRIRQGASPLCSFGGLLGIGAGALLFMQSGKTGDFLLPNLGVNSLILLLCLFSLPLKRPFVAWTSYFVRRYPLAWYWHPSIRPAYTEVTVLWAFFFGTRLLLQILLLRSGEELLLFAFSILSGWPAMLLLLAGSYLYGTWRLRCLKGPGAEEFRRGDPPPWKGQSRGF